MDKFHVSVLGQDPDATFIISAKKISRDSTGTYIFTNESGEIIDCVTPIPGLIISRTPAE